MTQTHFSAAERAASDYYDSADADCFYEEVWGGEDIHIGLYASETEAIAPASQRTVNALIALIGSLPRGATVVDWVRDMAVLLGASRRSSGPMSRRSTSRPLKTPGTVSST